MSTKRLARTVIEGGRDGYNKYLRRESNRLARVRAREACHRLVSESEEDDYDFFVEREPVWKSFDDKLAPLQRFLESSVGRNFSKVVSELVERVDTRKTSGLHILFCHALPSVRKNEIEGRYARFELDAQGRLVKLPRRRYRRNEPKTPLPCSESALAAWLARRAVLELGSRIYWFEATPSGAFRQARALSEAEAKFFASLPAWCREELTPEERKKELAAERVKTSSCAKN